MSRLPALYLVTHRATPHEPETSRLEVRGIGGRIETLAEDGDAIAAEALRTGEADAEYVVFYDGKDPIPCVQELQALAAIGRLCEWLDRADD